MKKEFEELTEPYSEAIIGITKNGDVTFKGKGFRTTHLQKFTNTGREETFKKSLIQ